MSTCINNVCVFCGCSYTLIVMRSLCWVESTFWVTTAQTCKASLASAPTFRWAFIISITCDRHIKLSTNIYCPLASACATCLWFRSDLPDSGVQACCHGELGSWEHQRAQQISRASQQQHIPFSLALHMWFLHSTASESHHVIKIAQQTKLNHRHVQVKISLQKVHGHRESCTSLSIGFYFWFVSLWVFFFFWNTI